MPFVLQFYIHLIKGKVIKHRSDNMNVTHILLSGSEKCCWHVLALEIFKSCFQNGTQLHTEWVPRWPEPKLVLPGILGRFKNHFRVPNFRFCSIRKNENLGFLNKMINGGQINKK